MLLFIRFATPALLLFLFAVPLVVLGFVLLDRERSTKAAAWATPALVPNMVKGRPGRLRYVPFAFFLLGLMTLLVGFARPEAMLSSVKQGATVVLVLDTSGSMAATDVRPTRLDAADAALTTFAKDLPSDYRLALVQFSAMPAVRMPPTYDHQQLAKVLPHKAEEQGTAIGDALTLALKVAKGAVGTSKPGNPHPPAAILLLSDGTQNEGTIEPGAAAAAARKADVPVSTVALGTDRGIVRQPLKGGAVNTQQVPVDPTTLKAIAKASGGTFYSAASAAALETVYKNLGSHLVHVRKEHEITDRVTALALVLMLGGVVLSGVLFQRIV